MHTDSAAELMANPTPDELKHEARQLRAHGDSIGGSIRNDCHREAELLLVAAQEIESDVLMIKRKSHVNRERGVLTQFLCVSLPLAMLNLARRVCVGSPAK